MITPNKPQILSAYDGGAIVSWSGTFPVGTTFNVYWEAGEDDLIPPQPFTNVFETGLKSRTSSVRKNAGINTVPDGTNIYIAITSVTTAGESSQSVPLFLSICNSTTSDQVAVARDSNDRNKMLSVDEKGHSFVTTTPNTPVFTRTADTAELDILNRKRSSSINARFDGEFRFNKKPIDWDEVLTGTATSTHVPNLSSVELSIGTSASDSALLQTKQYIRYAPGDSQRVFMTGRMNSTKLGLVQRIGQFDANNGLFFQTNDNDISVVRRSSTSDSSVDDVIIQDNWNLDKLDGTGPSRKVLDISKIQLYIIDYSWLGAGRIRWGFLLDNEIVYCHDFISANNIIVPSISDPNLPLRYEIFNNANTTSSSTMLATSYSVHGEGSNSEILPGAKRSVNRGTSRLSLDANGVSVPVLSIRLKSAFNKSILIPVIADVASGSAATALIRILIGNTLTGANWISAGTNSAVEFDISATSSSGGDVIDSMYLVSGNAGTIRSRELGNEIVAASNINNISDIVTIMVAHFGGGSATNFFASIVFREVI